MVSPDDKDGESTPPPGFRLKNNPTIENIVADVRTVFERVQSDEEQVHRLAVALFSDGVTILNRSGLSLWMLKKLLKETWKNVEHQNGVLALQRLRGAGKG